jgi:hypothetical protein
VKQVILLADDSPTIQRLVTQMFVDSISKSFRSPTATPPFESSTKFGRRSSWQIFTCRAKPVMKSVPT